MAKNHYQNLLQDLRNWHKQWLTSEDLTLEGLTSTSPQIATKAKILATGVAVTEPHVISADQ
ncbi:hypothetical protein [uncultured Nostoc sp.]|uniref:hypothetical protein n=1 Tax=uncultured Nostoc sp. TaxID=340711 RepID=UPI00262D46DD|nr:hypothetical protein [uncultured Nostoc sp.]